MRPSPLLAFVLLNLAAAGLWSSAADKAFAPIQIKLTVMEGDLFNRDCRVFGVPVECSGVKTNFTWACGGETIVSEAFAKKAGLNVKTDPDNAMFQDGAGKPIFAGSAAANLVIGGRSHSVTAWVMRDGETNKDATGIIGYAVARQYQWEVDPRIPQLTLRAPRTKLEAKPLATLPIKDENSNIWLNINIRNSPVDVCLIPQSTDLQADASLQKKWDLDHGGLKVETHSYMGNVRTVTLAGKSGAYFSKNIYESDVMVILMDENPNARSGIGQSLLNRFVYCVDAETKEFNIMAKVTMKEVRATTQPGK